MLVRGITTVDFSPPDEIARLIRLAQAGDAAAFGDLYDAHYEKVYRYLYYHLPVHQRDAAEDMVQEVFLKAMDALPSYTFRGVPFAAWLVRIARNHMIDHTRKAAKRDEVPIDDLPIPADDDPEALYGLKASRAELGRALDTLTPEQRDVIVLRIVEDMSIAETAQIMDKTEMAIKAMQARALKALRRALDPVEDGEGVPGQDAVSRAM